MLHPAAFTQAITAVKRAGGGRAWSCRGAGVPHAAVRVLFQTHASAGAKALSPGRRTDWAARPGQVQIAARRCAKVRVR